MARFDNPFKVQATPMDYTDPYALPEKTYKQADIIINGKRVGRLQGWTLEGENWSNNDVYELGKDTWGEQVSYTLGTKSGGRTITTSRMELWYNEFPLILGYDEQWNTITEQPRSFEILEFLYRGSKLYEAWKYIGCRVVSFSRSDYSATGDGVITYNVTIKFGNRIKILDTSGGGF